MQQVVASRSPVIGRRHQWVMLLLQTQLATSTRPNTPSDTDSIRHNSFYRCRARPYPSSIAEYYYHWNCKYQRREVSSQHLRLILHLQPSVGHDGRLAVAGRTVARSSGGAWSAVHRTRHRNPPTPKDVFVLPRLPWRSTHKDSNQPT